MCPLYYSDSTTLHVFGNSVIVDQINGDDTQGSRGLVAFKTIQAALAVAQSGDCVYIAPGTYNLTSGITLPDNVTVRGMNAQAVTIQMLNVVANTDLITMGNNNRVEDVTLKLTSAGHHTLRSIVYPGTRSGTSKLRTLNITVDNSGAGSAGTSNVYAIHSNGTGTPNDSFNAVRACMITVNSAGLGNKRGILVDTANNFSSRDSNFVVTNAGGAGSYIALETNNAAARLVNRSSYANGATADISQTLGTLVWEGQLANLNANGLNFNSLVTPAILEFCIPGAVKSASPQFLYPGTFNPSTNEISLNLPSGAVVKNMVIESLIAPGTGHTDVYTVRKNGVNTSLTVTLSGATLDGSDTVHSVTYNAGDDLSIQLNTTNASLGANVVVLVEAV